MVVHADLSETQRRAYVAAGVDESESDSVIQPVRIVAKTMDQARRSAIRDPDMAPNGDRRAALPRGYPVLSAGRFCLVAFRR